MFIFEQNADRQHRRNSVSCLLRGKVQAGAAKFKYTDKDRGGEGGGIKYERLLCHGLPPSVRPPPAPMGGLATSCSTQTNTNKLNKRLLPDFTAPPFQ